TPGTLTLELDEETWTLFIHVLHLESIQASRRAIHHLEALVMAAFPRRGVVVPGAEREEVACCCKSAPPSTWQHCPSPPLCASSGWPAGDRCPTGWSPSTPSS